MTDHADLDWLAAVPGSHPGRTRLPPGRARRSCATRAAGRRSMHRAPRPPRPPPRSARRHSRRPVRRASPSSPPSPPAVVVAELALGGVGHVFDVDEAEASPLLALSTTGPRHRPGARRRHAHHPDPALPRRLLDRRRRPLPRRRHLLLRIDGSSCRQSSARTRPRAATGSSETRPPRSRPCTSTRHRARRAMARAPLDPDTQPAAPDPSAEAEAEPESGPRDLRTRR